jgi:hypothetical protein
MRVIPERAGSPSFPLTTDLQIIESREQGVNGLVDRSKVPGCCRGVLAIRLGSRDQTRNQRILLLDLSEECKNAGTPASLHIWPPPSPTP